MPPQMMMESDLSMRLSMTNTLSEILAPPTMEVRGVLLRAGSSTLLNAASSLATRRPETQGILPRMPTMEEWARWAVPNASQTYTSPNFDSESRKAPTASSLGFTFSPVAGSLPFPSSSA